MSTIPMDPRLRARRIEVLRAQGRRRLRILIALVIASVLAVAVWWVIVRSPLFDVDGIEVVGAGRVDVDQVIAAAGIDRGEPLVEVDVEAAEAAVADLPWVDTVRADVGLRGEVTLELTERVPVAALRGEEGWLVVDVHGRVLDRRSSLEGVNVIIDGPSWSVDPGGWVGERALPAIELAAALPAGIASKIASIADGEENGLELVLFGGGRVVIGSTDELDAKFHSTLTMLTQVDLRCLDRIDVRAPAVPVLTRIDGCS